MRARFAPALAVLSVTMLTACGGDPAGPGGGGPLSAVVDGVAWQVASTPGAMQVLVAGNNRIIVAGSNAQARSLSITFPIPTEPGTVQLTNAATAFGSYMEGTQTWMSAMPGGSGTLTVTSVDGRRVRGTFEFDARATGSESPATRVVRQGQFDITY